ncbi:MAG TPA: hypothetical protein VN628_15795 [Vicinamibacterales bacterium]|nr:hypothetical protein [Vicinamibacterales bacterium]
MRRFSAILCAAALVLASSVAFADDGDEGTAGQFRPRPVSNGEPHFAVGIKAGSLGIGVQVGTALASRVNLRGGANFFNYNDSLNKDGALYKGTLQLRSVEAKLDLFAIGGFHITPGVLLYNDNNLTATLSVSPGQSFTLGGVQYFSSAANPINGTAALTLNKFAPTLGIGFGNLLPRSARHWSLSTDLGVVFQGSPQFALGVGGQACAQNGSNCLPIASVPGASANIESERVKIQDDLKPFKYYPEVSIMFGWKF